MANLALGIDTGGTFTDGVVIDLNNEEIITSTKTITTRSDLTQAIGSCLTELLAVPEVKTDDIKLVSLSTTLATNAIVEGQGAEVGAIMIGFDPDEDLPTRHQRVVTGGCTIKGKIKEPLKEEEVRRAARELQEKVDAYAVCGYLGIRNPIQEKEAARIITETTGYPVVAAHQLSSDLGFQERVTTAVFNARLLPLITGLIDSVKKMLAKNEINAPLMVVRGDGSLISEQEARSRPVETSLSGPAASVVGARQLAGVNDGIIVDMGGTTTDLAVLQDGSPRINPQGARVGGWHTRIKAADIRTIGLGGDSLVKVSSEGELDLGPQRVFPLSWATNRYPHLLKELQQIERFAPFPLTYQPVSALVHIRDPEKFSLSRLQKNILEVIREKPHTIWKLAKKLEVDAELLPWEKLVETGCLHRTSLTPTDILHWKGTYTDWNREAAELGLKIMAERRGQQPKELAEDVLFLVYYRTALLVVEAALEQEGAELDFSSREIEYLLDRMLVNPDGEFLDLNLKLNKPLIGVGAPVRAYFPEIARMLKAELKLPEAAEVANAVGTVMGKIIERMTIIIKPDEVGAGYAVHTPEERLGFKDLEVALAEAEKIGREFVLKRGREAGGKNLEINMEREDKYGRLSSFREEDKIFIETRLEFSAVGKPWTA